jgi:hypothetical protein
VPLAERFWAKVRKTETCWLWTANLNNSGYGLFWVAGVDDKVPAHRIAYELLIGPIPEGLTIDHLCRVRACVRPDHLEPVTHRENMLRGKHARKMHCPKGHPYDVRNTFITRRGHRECRACKQKRERDRYRLKHSRRPQ